MQGCLWDIAVSWPHRDDNGDAYDLVQDFTPSPICAKIDALAEPSIKLLQFH